MAINRLGYSAGPEDLESVKGTGTYVDILLVAPCAEDLGARMTFRFRPAGPESSQFPREICWRFVDDSWNAILLPESGDSISVQSDPESRAWQALPAPLHFQRKLVSV